MAAPESFGLDEVEDLEMTEADGALLRQLLEEFEIEATDSKRAGYDTEQSPKSTDGTSKTMIEAQKSPSEEGFLVHDSSWIDEIAEADPAVPSGEAAGWWYPEDMVGLLEFDFSDVTTEEMAYTCLWDDS